MIDRNTIKLFETLQQYFYKKYGTKFFTSILSLQDKIKITNDQKPYIGIVNLKEKIEQCKIFLKENV